MRSRFTSLVRELPPAYWSLWWGTVINRLGSFAVPFLMLYLTSRLAISPGIAALMVSVLGAGSFLAQLAGGELADRFGRRPVMLMSFFVTPLAMVTLGLLRQPWQLVAALFVLGFFMDLYRPAVSAAVADLVPADKHTRAFGYLYWAINLGAALAPIAAGFMANFDFFLLFLGDAVTTLVFGLVVLARVPETQPREAVHAARISLAARGRELTRAPVLLVFALLTLVFGSIYAQYQVTLPLHMQASGLSPADYGLALSVNGFLIVLVTLSAMKRIERWPRFTAMAGAALLLGLGYGLTEFGASLPFFAFTVGVWTLGEIIGATVSPVIVSDLAPVELRGLFQGVFGSAWGLAFFVGPALGGLVYENYGSLALWGGCFLLSLVLCLGYLALSIPARRRSSPAKHSLQAK
jgi:MFS family permease